MIGGYWATVLTQFMGADSGERGSVRDCIAAIVRLALDDYMRGTSPLGAEMAALLQAAANRKDEFYAELDPVSRMAVWAQLNNLRKAKAKFAPGAPAANLNTEKEAKNVG